MYLTLHVLADCCCGLKLSLIDRKAEQRHLSPLAVGNKIGPTFDFNLHISIPNMLLIFLANAVLGKCFKSENEESEVLRTQHWAQCPSGHIPSQACLTL